MYFCRCRIPECDGTEPSFRPEWLQNAVPFHQHDGRFVPRRCRRFAPRNFSLLSENAERNDSCSPDSFDNRSVIRCNEWVYDGEETTILREVGYHHMALQPTSALASPFGGFVTITFLQGWIVSPAPNPQPGGPDLRI
jgi:hypothetical protein